MILPEVRPARRGERPLELEEFKRHIAQAVGLEYVGVLLGAGASVACGGQTMMGLWKEFERDHGPLVDRLATAGFIPCPLIDGPPNLEETIDRLTVALMDAERKGDDTVELAELRHALLRAVLKAAILDDGWLCNPETAAAHPRLASHVRLLTRLAYTRRPGQPAPWVFTTNYDMAIELAAEGASLNVGDGFQGFHHRVFTPSAFDLGLRNTEARGEAQFGSYEIYLAKLHGSLSWQPTAEGGVRAVQIATACQDVMDFIAGKTDKPPSVLVFPSSAKFVDTVGFVYGELMRRLTHFLARPNVCLIVGGYGFGDNHLNRLLLSALNNPTLQLIVYLPEIDGFDDLGTPTNLAALSPGQQSFLRLKLPQIAVLGGRPAAFFDQLASHLPDPTLLDDPADRARKIALTLKEYLADGSRA